MANRCLGVLAVVLVMVAGTPPLEGVQLRFDSRLDTLSGPAWRAEGVGLALERREAGEGALRITIERLILPSPVAVLSDLELHCPDFALALDRLSCTRGRLRIAQPQGTPALGRVDFVYRRGDGALEFAIADLSLAGGRSSVLGRVREGIWTVDLEASALDVAAALGLVQAPSACSRGRVSLTAKLSGWGASSQDAVQTLGLKLFDVRCEDPGGRFGVTGLNGDLAWNRAPAPRRSRLHWSEGHIYRLPVGAAELAMESRGENFRLLGETRVPVLDGAVVVERMEGWGIASADFGWAFDGRLAPVSMARLSRALDWPPLVGRLSGVIPDVRYGSDRLEVGGVLEVHVFEGDIVITRLRIEDLFGTAPKVDANVDIRDLDLLTLTRTFDFGRIEGRLGGEIRNLRLEDWRPTAFEARLATPPGDRSRHRISQRAVENLSALGGGGAAVALSQGFLRMFKEFRYKRLGINCRLANGVCEMGGVAPAGQDGYYLVEGEGLPRIDVIGYTRRVDWDELLGRLEAALQSQEPVIQ